MASLGFMFDATQVAPDQGRSPPIPKGEYRMMLRESELKPTKDGSGMIIVGQFEVVDDPHAGHIIFHNFNIRNKSEKAMEIAFAQLSALCHATGILNVQDTSQLHNRIFKGSVKIGGGGKKLDATGNDTGEVYESNNEITAFKKDDGGAGQPGQLTIPGMPTPNQHVQQPAAPQVAGQPVAGQQQPVQQPDQVAPAVDPNATPPWMKQPDPVVDPNATPPWMKQPQ